MGIGTRFTRIFIYTQIMRFFTTLLALSGSLHAAEILFDAFESDGFGEWQVEGTAFGKSPTSSSPAGMNGTVGKYANIYYVSSAHQGDVSTGSLTSTEFKIQLPYIAFLVSGGNHPGKTAVQLFVDGKITHEATGQNDLTMRPTVWDVSGLKGKTAQLRIIDAERKAWGIINADHILFTDLAEPKFPRTSGGGNADKDGLVASEAIPGLSVPEGTEVKIFADNASSDVYSPTALSVDEQGRVFVAETHRLRHGVEDNRNHLYWLMDDISSQTTDDRVAMHKKWDHKRSVADLTKVSEKVRVLVDTDGDGVADESKVFADGFNDVLDGVAAGIMAFEGTIYFACIPKIWTLTDKDGDLISDEREVLQDGMGVRVSFSGHDLNGFALGPDGRFYATIGDRGFNFTTQEGRKYKYPNQGAIFRFDPDGSNFEVVHFGLRNPKEIAFDKFGTAITVDNNSDQGDRARVVFIMDGADSGWRMGHQVLHSFHKTAGIPDRPINQWMQEKMWEPHFPDQPAHIVPPIANLTSGPSGLAYYPGTGYQLKSRDQFLICDYRGGAASSGIWHFGIKQKGAGFSLDQFGKFSWGTAVTDVEWGYDGKLYIADYISGWQSHKAGRIYTMEQSNTGDEVAKIMASGISKKSSVELAKLLTHPDLRLRLRAQYHLSSRDNALPIFISAANQRFNPTERLHGLWGLGILARKEKSEPATNFLVRALKNTDHIVRGQAAQALGESTLTDGSPLLPLLKDSSLRVRALAALSLGRKPAPDGTSHLVALLEENKDRDPYLRHAGIMGLIGNATSKEIITLASHPSPAVRRAAVIALRRLQDPEIVRFIADPDLNVSNEAIRAINDTEVFSVRAALAALLDDYTADSKNPGRPLSRMITRRLLHSAYRLGHEKNLLRLIKFASHQKNDQAERLEAMRLISVWTEPHVVDQSIGKHSPVSPRKADEVKNTLAKNLHILLQSDTPVLAKTLGLALKYEISHDGLDSGTLTRLLRDEKVDGETRAGALKLLAKSPRAELAKILTEAAQSSNDQLATTALELASTRDPAANVAALRGALLSKSTTRRQTAWNIAATLPAEHAIPLLRDGMTQLAAGKGAPSSTFELLEAVRSRPEPVMKTALTDYQKSLEEKDPLAKWAPALAGGDAKNGFKIFQSHAAAQCMRCHRHEPGHTEGGEAGPNLMGVALRLNAKGLLESIIAPNAQISPGFGIATLNLNDGTSKAGFVLADTKSHFDLKEGETTWRIQKSDLKEMPTLTSAMLPMENILKPQEVRDLVAWLLTLTKESGEKTPAYEVQHLGKPTKTVSEETTIDPAVMKLGKSQYMLCAACHGPDGKGVPNLAPPLAGSEWVTGPVENLARIQMRGLTGPIEVAGKAYDLPIPMAPLGAAQTDEQMAAVLTYIRNSFGNSAPAVTADQIAPFRDEVGKPFLTVKDLIQPKQAKSTDSSPSDKPAKTEEPKTDKPKTVETPKDESQNQTPTENTVSEENTIDPAVMELGEESYLYCSTCHDPTGVGKPGLAPPLAGSEWATGPVENLIRIQMRGLTGPIKVAGELFDTPTVMPAAAALYDDEKMAAVLTYIRNSWGNSASAVTPDQITPFRAEVGKPMLTVADLIQPEVEEKETHTGPLAEVPSGGIGAPTSGIIIFALVLVITGLGALRMKIANG